ncbi:MAG: hypothetical protein J6A04_03470 [Clostridia bacterium]|nr:hypothetical protein [Clostridia bacterium]
MIKDVKIYNVLISCASDIKEELDIIEAVIDFYNRTTGYNNYIQLKVHFWKFNSYPLYGNDPQEILFDEFINDCDFAIVIFWTNFGHPTMKYKSGVQEEIENFYSNAKDIIMFFSDCPVCPSKIDLKQLKNVRDYKKSIEKERIGLHYTYNNLKEFEDKLRYCIYTYMEDMYGYR